MSLSLESALAQTRLAGLQYEIRISDGLVELVQVGGVGDVGEAVKTDEVDETDRTVGVYKYNEAGGLAQMLELITTRLCYHLVAGNNQVK